MKQDNPLIAIVGRPNVGKSTLFNRIIGERKSIVESQPGVTRDRIYADGQWTGKHFSIVDTGGLLPNHPGEITGFIEQQVNTAIEEADLILFLVDIKAGMVPADEDIARELRKIVKPVILVANKADNPQAAEAELADFYRLGLSKLIPVSAVHGLNVNSLLDEVVGSLPLKRKKEQLEGMRIAVVGRPNVGKSSFINALLREDRLIVSKQPGTTRDAVDTVFTMGEDKFIFIDTAGMRPKSKIKKGVESYSLLRTQRSIERCDIALILVDADEGITAQDSKIASYVYEKGRGCIIGVNKWDLVVKSLKSQVESDGNPKMFSNEISKAREKYRESVKDKLRFLNFAPLVFMSALTGKRVTNVIDLIRLVAVQQVLHPSSGVLKKVFDEAVSRYHPPGGQVKPVTLHRLSQVAVKPPTFVLFAKNPQFIVESYLRYLNNRLREAFGFEGTPIRIIPRKGK